ncbi:MAG: site-specific DNA-methyltransferase [Acidimicrobiia bacterium]|nr:site-specific DNA-methyltransferase [Acidimicrobiia bacterium]
MALGDARDIDRVWRDLAGRRSPTAIITSPPYGSLKDYGVHGQIGHGQSYAEFLDDMDDVLKGLTKIALRVDDSSVVVDTFRQADPLSDVWSLQQVPGDLSHVAREHGWIARDVIIWQKDRTLPWSGNGRLRNSFEYVLMFVRGSGFRYNIDAIRDPVRSDGYWKRWPERHHPAGSVPANVWSIPIPVQGSWRKDASHVCPLPRELVRRLVLLASIQ